jgi:hypothetical protein
MESSCLTATETFPIEWPQADNKNYLHAVQKDL